MFNNARLVGGFSGVNVGKPHLFGWDFNAIKYPGRYAIVAMGFFTVVALMVASVRRGRTGRRLLAVRTNERAAAALGISVAGAKVYAFALSAGIAAIGGTLLAFRKDVIIYKSEFLELQLHSGRRLVVHRRHRLPVRSHHRFDAGVGLAGRTAVERDLLSLTKYIQLIGGVILVLLVLQNQDGFAKEQINYVNFIGQKLRKLIPRLPERPAERIELPVDDETGTRQRIAPQTLEVRNLTVRYGGVVAVDDVNLSVQPGRIVGLIGPNGAGKTSAIDAITGFTRVAAGTVQLDGRDLISVSATVRARAGLSRSFQSLELFEDATVFDNLRAASDPRDRLSYLRDLVFAENPPLPGHVVAAIREFQLEDDLLRHVAGSALRPAAAAGHRPGRRHPTRRAAARRAAPPASATSRRPSLPTSSRLADDWGSPCCSSSTT